MFEFLYNSISRVVLRVMCRKSSEAKVLEDILIDFPNGDCEVISKGERVVVEGYLESRVSWVSLSEPVVRVSLNKRSFVLSVHSIAPLNIIDKLKDINLIIS